MLVRHKSSAVNLLCSEKPSAFINVIFHISSLRIPRCCFQRIRSPTFRPYLYMLININHLNSIFLFQNIIHMTQYKNIIMQTLLQKYESNPANKALDLSFNYIKDLTSLITALSKFKYLSTLNLHGNKITHFPRLQALKQLRVLDISNNPIKIDDLLLDNLYCIPLLQQLSINATGEQCNKIIENLPKLKLLNSKTIVRQTKLNENFKSEATKRAELLQIEMENIKEVYNGLAKILDENKKSKTSEEEFAFLYKEILEELHYFCAGLQDDLSREGVFIYCKNKLTTILDNHLVRLLDENGLNHLVDTVEAINKIKQENFESILKNVFSASYGLYAEEQTQKLGTLRKEKLYHNEILRLKKQAIQLRRENKKIDTLVDRERQIYDPRRNATNNRSTSRNNLSTRNINKSPSKASITKSPSRASIPRSHSKASINKTDINVNKNKFTQLKPSNNQEINKHINQSKETFLQYVIAPFSIKSQNVAPNRFQNQTPISVQPNKFAPIRTPTSRQLKISEQSESFAEQRISQLSPAQRTTSERNSVHKIIPLDQFLLLIQEIMKEKAIINQRCLQKGENFQTAEEFLYTFFTRKYGLEDIALEWSIAVIKCIQQHSKTKIQVQIFGKILKNQLYEEYYSLYKQFDGILKQRFKHFKQNVSQKQLRIIYFQFFPQDDYDQFQKIIKQVVFPWSTTAAIRELHRHKLQFEEKHLKRFIILFKQIDKDEDGALNLNETKILAKGVTDWQYIPEQKEENLNMILKKITTLKKSRIIFSQAFQLMYEYIHID